MANSKYRNFACVVHIGNMVKAGLDETMYKKPEIVADHFIKCWENSGKNRKAAAAVCVSANQCYHMHLALMGEPTTCSCVSKLLWNSHVESMYSSKSQLKAYMLKEGIHQEKGEQVLYTVNMDYLESKQGKRSDLDLIEDLLNQDYTPDMIFEESFRFRRFEKLINAEYLYRQKKKVNLVKDMKCFWHVGVSGSGKSYSAYIKSIEAHSENDVYLCSDFNNASGSSGGFDAYKGEHILVLDDLRFSSIPYTKLLNILDCYSHAQTHARYQNIYNLWNEVHITSVYGPDEMYSHMIDQSQQSIDSFKQLIRRLTFITYHWINEIGKYCEFTIPAEEFTSTNDLKHKAYKSTLSTSFPVTKLEDF